MVATMKKHAVILVFVLLPTLIIYPFSNLSAVMPPHINGSIPESGGELLGDTLWFYGYSLSYGNLENLRLIDKTADRDVTFSSELNCETEGRGDAPGCQQSKCMLAITLNETIATHEYEVIFEETHIDFMPTFQFFGSAEDPGLDNDQDGITAKQGDCNDNDPEIYPGAVERCGDNLDRDCDGVYSVCCESVNNPAVVGGCLILSASR
jgi:hypothetical protein